MALIQTGPGAFFSLFLPKLWCRCFYLKLLLLCSSGMIICMMDKGDLFMLVKIKFLDCTELWCECKIHDYVFV